MSDRGHVLLVGDERKLSSDLIKVLRRRGFDLSRVTSARDAHAWLKDGGAEAVVVDFDLPENSTIELCRRISDAQPELPVMVLTHRPSLDTSVAAMRAGAYDYLVWPIPVEALALSLDRAVLHNRLKREVRRLRHRLQHGPRYGEIIGDSPAMSEIFETITRVAGSQAPVLVTGETGTGKELVARALHKGGSRASGPFVVVNCAAIPDSLLESELFGHLRGAFTDARTARKGLFVQAAGGSLLLDEVGDLPPLLQAKLLRVLQDKSVRPVGSDQEIPLDVRIIAATNRNLEGMVDEGLFRRDLYYRLNVIHLELPPLRSRSGDILLLAQHFLERACERAGQEIGRFRPATARRLLEYLWPGNIRELENCVERAVAFARGDSISVDDLPARVRNYKPSHVIVAAQSPDELVPLRTVEERYVRQVLQAVAGNKAAAARILGIERKTLYRKLGRWGMETGEEPT